MNTAMGFATRIDPNDIELSAHQSVASDAAIRLHRFKVAAAEQHLQQCIDEEGCGALLGALVWCCLHE